MAQIPRHQLNMNRFLESRWLVGSAAVVAISALYISTSKKNDKKAGTRSLYDLPGPPRQFLIGSAAIFPEDTWFEIFNRWRKDYGPWSVSLIMPRGTYHSDRRLHLCSDRNSTLNNHSLARGCGGASGQARQHLEWASRISDG